MGDCLSAAIKYATEFNWAVFPVSPKNKKPLTPHGCKDAKKNVGAIKAWWKKWPDANIGIATGSASNLVVIDEDCDEDKGLDGLQSVTEWERIHGKLPTTYMCLTGRGDYHLYFRYDGTDIKNRAGLLEGVDVRGEGGYVIAPPSIHPNGTEYVWEYDPEEFELADANETVMELLAADKTSEPEQFKLPDKIQDGARNDTIFKLASSMQAQGLPDEAIRDAVYKTNSELCVQPLDGKELDLILSSALKYAKGELKVLSDQGEWREPKIALQVDKNGEITDRPMQRRRSSTTRTYSVGSDTTRSLMCHMSMALCRGRSGADGVSGRTLTTQTSGATSRTSTDSRMARKRWTHWQT